LGFDAGKPFVTFLLLLFDAGKPFVTFLLLLFDTSKVFVTLALPLITLALPFFRFALKREPPLVVTRNLLNERGLIANQQGHCFLKMDTRVGAVSGRHVP
jgi:hypothetical protein